MNKQILLIDDDDDEHEIFTQAVNIACLHCKCVCTDSAEGGIALLKSIVPDFIFVDINMPKMNGFECLSAIKKIDGYKNIPVILYSTGANEKVKDYALMLGAKDCISKTDSINALVKKLKKFL